MMVIWNRLEAVFAEVVHDGLNNDPNRSFDELFWPQRDSPQREPKGRHNTKEMEHRSVVIRRRMYRQLQPIPAPIVRWRRERDVALSY